MEGDNDKVFVAQIKRNYCAAQNNFFDILRKEIKEPLKLPVNNKLQEVCEFKPRVNKYYVPKKKSKLKVSTVREIRNQYEKDILETLPLELERQEKFLLRKIKGGYFKDEDTKKIALNLIKSDKPLSRTSWQMLMNLNPKGHSHSSQYILWNGQRIQINGSRGGKNKFICNYDVNNDQEFSRKSPVNKRKVQTRRGLLRDSLNIRFKPGPLQKKKVLDDSYQKFNVGEIKVVNLPKIGLHIQPSYGTALEPKITTFLQHMRALDGTISEKWAEFAGSVLGKATEEGAQIGTEKSVIFNLNYRYDQKRILMRNDLDLTQSIDNDNVCRPMDAPRITYNEDSLTHDIKSVINKMLDSVEISLNQHSMYSGEDEPRDISNHNRTYNISGVQVKEKEKKRKYCELDRLDVTVIRISENNKRNDSEPCQQSFCSLGCVCDSLECAYQIKDHCGKIECMFDCNCDFSKFKIADSLDGNCSEFIPGLVYLDKKINDKLAKEEQKFHQTVIVTDDKSILLKSRRRNWKTSKKYADFYSSMRLRTDIKNHKFPEILISKLKCENIEPWCMVHNLYKCFCKGKFLRSIVDDLSDVDIMSSMAYKDRGIAPVLDKTPPVLDKALPVLEKKPPISEKTLPVFEGILPVLEKMLPVVENRLPVVEKLLPVAEKTLPVVEKTLPIVEKTLPVSEKTLPVVENKLPVIEKTLPVLEKTLPVVEKTQPVIEKTLPVLEKTLKCPENYESITSDAKIVVKSRYPEAQESFCARIWPLYSRQFHDEYYRRTNKRIFEMEKNDKKLQTKLMSLINAMDGREQTDETQRKTLDKTDEVNENIEKIQTPNETINSDIDIQSSESSCARVLSFKKRKFSVGGYRRINKKILRLEKKNKTKQAKLISLIKNARECTQTEVTQTQDETVKVIKKSPNPKELLNKFLEQEKIMYPEASASKVKNKPNAKLMKWLESNLTKDFLETVEKGLWTTSLSRPSLGKVALYPWKFILSRYREKKNLFLLTTQQPFRIFMAVNTRYSFFNNCINVSQIPPSSIGEYPDMVRNLINNSGQDNFCILSGLSQCWELVGSVNKLNTQGEDKTYPENINESIFIDESSDDEDDVKCEEQTSNSDDVHLVEYDEKDTKNISKWFVMSIEDDVNELRFFRKGFFVKYDSIIRSIKIARKVGKTVRLSSQKCNPGSNGPRFGIYATADKNANTLFIGPYEEHEPLGIETARNSNHTYGGKKTGGLWITVNKTDNTRVTDNPLLFMPSPKNYGESVVSLDSDTDSDSDSTKKKIISSSSENADLSDERNSMQSNSKMNTIKIIKPIRIRKTDSFYHLGSQSLLKKIAFTKYLQQRNKVTGGNIVAPLGSFSLNKVPAKPLETSQPGPFEMKSKPSFNKPVAEIAPQIKINNISALCSNSTNTELPSNKKKPEGMFVLKPEEINKRLANNYFRILEPIEIEDNDSDEVVSSEEKRLDVEEFLDSSVICAAPDVYVISDDEDDGVNMSIGSVFKNVWITCANIPNIGWIAGRRNDENKLSFVFPGFVISDYYDEKEALEKINQLFSRKVFIPKNIQVKWQVIENEEDLDGKQKLCKEDLISDFVLTKRGLIHKDKLVTTGKRNKKVNKHSNPGSEGCSSEGPSSDLPATERPATKRSSSEGHLSEKPSSEKRPPEKRSPEKPSPEEPMEVDEISRSDKILNAYKLSNQNNIQGTVTAVASTSIDADGNDQGIKIYTIAHTDENVDKNPCKSDKNIASKVKNVFTDTKVD